MKKLLNLLPWLFLALFTAEIIAVLMPKKEGEYHLREFGRLPVLFNGRVQPFDSVGKNTLLQIRGTGDVPLEEVPSWKFWYHGKKLKSSEWLAEVLFKPEVADTRPIFLIHHPELLAELNLRDKGVEKSGLRYFNFVELATNRTESGKTVLQEIEAQSRLARNEEEKNQTTLQKQVMTLHNAIFHYDRMKSAVAPSGWDDFEKELAAFQESVPAGMAAMQAREAKQEHDEAALNRFWRPLSFFFELMKDPGAGQVYPLVVPPLHEDNQKEKWGTVSAAIVESVRDRALYPPVKWLAAMASAYHQEKPAAFNTAVAEYKGWLSVHFPKELTKGRHEFVYNDLKAFLHAMIIDLFAFLLATGSLLTLGSMPALASSLRRSAVWLVALALVVHTAGLIFRMYLEGRPPVTNLYSSAVFIGWGAAILGLVLERVFRVGLGVAVASFVAAISLLIAHNLALSGDTMKMLVAVLDTNFWLATHVVVITLGYSATFVAGLLGIGYILLGLFTPVLRQQTGTVELNKVLAKMTYAIVCFATLFSFVGTVLGGIWADQSWGRFWGWDPKENGALIIVLWNAVVLHARWGGMIRERGLMNMAIMGNVVTSWSWFGTNMLGVGLHSYGFMDSAFRWLMGFIGSQIILIALGSIPLRFWKSFRTGTAPPGDSTTPKGTPRLKPA